MVVRLVCLVVGVSLAEVAAGGFCSPAAAWKARARGRANERAEAAWLVPRSALAQLRPCGCSHASSIYAARPAVAVAARPTGVGNPLKRTQASVGFDLLGLLKRFAYHHAYA